jgi:single-strand DNA-binding protein
MSLQNEGLLSFSGWAAGDVRSGVQGESKRPWASFRFVWTPRWFDRSSGKYADASSNFLTVWCYWELATNVQSSLHKGDPLMVLGRLRVVERKVEGRSFDDCSVTAYAIGHNLAWGTSMFRRVRSAARPSSMSEAGGEGLTVVRSEPPPWEVETEDGQAA